MGIFDKLFNRKSPEKSEDVKKTFVQDYENNRWFLDWSGMTRSDGLIDYENYKAAYTKHPTVVRCIQYRADKILEKGITFEPAPGVKNPKQSNLDMLNQIFSNLDPDGVRSGYEIFYSSICDYLRDGIKPIQIDMGDYPYLYDTLEIGTLQPRIMPNGLFKNDGQGHWIQIIEGQQCAKLDNDELIWLRMPDSVKLIYPQSPLEPLLVNIETDILGREFSYNRFANPSNLGQVYVLPENSTVNQAKIYLKYIKDNYVSTRKSFGSTDQKAAKPIVLYGGTTVDTNMSKDFGDFQFVKLKEVTDKDICIAYKIPPRLLGYEAGGLGQTGANVEARNQFYQDVIWSDQTLLEAQINKQYIVRRLSITDWVIKFPRPRAVDAKTEVVNRSLLVKSGIETPSEARSGLRSVFPELLEENDLAADIRVENMQKPIGSELSTSKAVIIGSYDTKAVKKQKIKKYDHKKVKNQMTELEEDLRSRVLKTVAKMSEAAKRKIPGMVMDNKYKDIENYSLPYKNEILDVFSKVGVKTFKTGADTFIDMAGKKAMKLSDYEKLVRVEALQAGKVYTISMESAIQTNVLSGIARKLSENEVIGIIDKAINKAVIQNSATFRTVTTKFYNQGIQKEAYANRDFVKKMQFSAILDDRTSDRCERLNSLVVDVDSPEFDSITPPLHFNCRSLWVPITTDDLEQNPGSYETTPSKEVNKIIASTPGFDV